MKQAPLILAFIWLNIATIHAISPTITQCPANITVNIGSACNAAMPNMLATFQATDNCPTPTTLTYTQSPVAGTTLSGHGTVQTVVFTVTDNCGQSSTCSATVTLKDIRSPQVLCHNKILEITPSGTATITVNDVLNAAFDDCTASNDIQLSLDKSVFACVDLFASPITGRLIGTDLAGNTNYCVFSVTLQDNMNICPPQPVVLSGKVKTESGVGIKNVQMVLKLMGTTVNSYTTDATGNYSFTLTPNTNYTIELTKNTNLLNGVTNADVVAIHKHYLNTLPLTSPYKIMAANVTDYDDSNSTVNMADEIRVTQLLNGNSNPFNVSSWSFIPQSHTFTTTPPAFPKPQPIYPFVINIVVTTTTYDFIGIKEGDATGDADPNQ